MFLISLVYPAHTPLAANCCSALIQLPVNQFNFQGPRYPPSKESYTLLRGNSLLEKNVHYSSLLARIYFRELLLTQSTRISNTCPIPVCRIPPKWCFKTALEVALMDLQAAQFQLVPYSSLPNSTLASKVVPATLEGAPASSKLPLTLKQLPNQGSVHAKTNSKAPPRMPSTSIVETGVETPSGLRKRSWKLALRQDLVRAFLLPDFSRGDAGGAGS